MIVVEGYDATGKSVLCRTLAETFGMPVYHAGPSPDLDDLVTWLNRCRTRFEERCIQDRVTQISEAVYGRSIFRRRLAYGRLKDLAKAKALVYCRPDVDVIVRALREQHVVKEWDTPDHLDRVERQAVALVGTYDGVIEKAGTYVPTIYYDRTAHGHLAGVTKFIGGLI